MAKRRVKRSKARPVRAGVSINDRINKSWRNLVLFAVLFAFSLLLYSISASTLFLNLFGTLSILFGFISFALLVVIAVLLIRRSAQ